MTRVVRDSQLVAPTCPDCGCRLERFESTLLEGTAFRHFRLSPFFERDANGCPCKNLSTLFEVKNRQVVPFWGP